MAAPTNAANVKKALANSEPSTHGTSRHFAAARQFGRFWTEADIGPDFMSTRLNIVDQYRLVYWHLMDRISSTGYGLLHALF